MEKLHPGARWLFRIGAYMSFIFLIIFLSFFSVGFFLRFGFGFGYIILIVLVNVVVLVIVLGEVYARLAYNNWKYEFTKRELKTERGIIWKSYKSIPYERVQNVDIRRGILARLLGFSSLDVQTAGYSGFHVHRRGGWGSMAEGHIPAIGIQKAEDIREMIMKKIGKRAGV